MTNDIDLRNRAFTFPQWAFRQDWGYPTRWCPGGELWRDRVDPSVRHWGRISIRDTVKTSTELVAKMVYDRFIRLNKMS